MPMRWPTRHSLAPRTCTSITQSPNRIWSRRVGRGAGQRRSGGRASGSESDGITDPDALVNAPPSFEVPVKAPIGGEVVEQDVSAGQLIQPGTTQCFMISDTSTSGCWSMSIRKICPTCAREIGHHSDRYVSRSVPRAHSYVAASLDPNHAHAAGPHRDQQSRRKTEERHVRNRDGKCGHDPKCHCAPGCSGPARYREPALCLCRGSANQFGRRSVTLGESLNGKTEITSGLKPGDHVIGNGSLFLQFANSLQR
jgi:membrane fusion protein, heavy metal efflux system